MTASQKPDAICTICGARLFLRGGKPWLTAGTKGLPVCLKACLPALAKWSKNKKTAA